MAEKMINANTQIYAFINSNIILLPKVKTNTYVSYINMQICHGGTLVLWWQIDLLKENLEISLDIILWNVI